MSGKKLQSLHETEFTHFNHNEEKSQSIVGGPTMATTATTMWKGHNLTLSAAQTSYALVKINLVTWKVKSTGNARTNGKTTKTATATGRELCCLLWMKAKKPARQIHQRLIQFFSLESWLERRLLINYQKIWLKMGSVLKNTTALRLVTTKLWLNTRYLK